MSSWLAAKQTSGTAVGVTRALGTEVTRTMKLARTGDDTSAGGLAVAAVTFATSRSRDTAATRRTGTGGSSASRAATEAGSAGQATGHGKDAPRPRLSAAPAPAAACGRNARRTVELEALVAALAGRSRQAGNRQQRRTGARPGPSPPAHGSAASCCASLIAKPPG